jgi:hypothetical protein
MGMQRNNGPAPAGQQIVREDLAELAGSRTPPRTPQRQRGIWSFLTWPFVIAPIVAAESILLGHAGVAANEDPDDHADHGRGQPVPTSSQDGPPASAIRAADDGRDDQTDDSPRLMRLVPKTLNHDDLTHEDHAKNPIAHDVAATASPAGDGGGGGGGGAGGGTEASDPADLDSLASSGSLDSSMAGTGSPSELSGTPVGILTEMLHQVVVGAAPTEITIGNSLSGLVIDPAVAELSGLAPAATTVISTITSSVGGILASDGLNPLVNLKEILGFDLGINQSGEFTATDLGAALDHIPSYALDNSVLTPVLHPVMAIATPVTDGLPVLDLGTTNPLDGLFGAGNHSVIGQLGDALADGGDHSGELGGTISAIKGSLVDNVISITADQHVGNLTDALTATSSVGSANTPSTLIGTFLAAIAVPDSTHVGIVGEATDMTPGHSIELTAASVPEADVLFRGNSYTDYHVALQSTGSSVGSGTAPTLSAGAANISDTGSLAHIDVPTSSPPASAPAASHQDTSLSHISTTASTVLDDLSLRGHTH